MKDLFVPYELAIKLKEKGFNQSCLAYWGPNTRSYYPDTIPDGEIMSLQSNESWSEECINGKDGFLGEYTAAPLWQQVIDWLREEKKIEVNVISTTMENYRYALYQVFGSSISQNVYNFKTYNEALKSGIEKALELI